MGRRGKVAKAVWDEVKATDEFSITPPEELTGDALREWNRLIPMLDKMGRIHNVDLGVLSVYCQAWASWLDCQRFLAKQGPTYVVKDKDGRLKFVGQFPQVAIANRAALQLKALANDLGLSPSGRARLLVQKEIQQFDELDMWDLTNRPSGESVEDALKRKGVELDELQTWKLKKVLRRNEPGYKAKVAKCSPGAAKQ
jgi:P27 family predicted phage terminase small subunit